MAFRVVQCDRMVVVVGGGGSQNGCLQSFLPRLSHVVLDLPLSVNVMCVDLEGDKPESS